IRSAYLLRAHAAIVPVTWSPAVIRSLMWTPSTFMQSTRVMPGTRSGSLTDDLRAFRTNIISNNFERLSLRLFARAQSAMWLSSSSTVSDVTASTIRQGRNHGLKVGGVQKFFFVRGRAKSGRERRFKMVRKIFFRLILYLF